MSAFCYNKKCRCAIYFMFYHAEAGKHPLQITLFGDLSIGGDWMSYFWESLTAKSQVEIYFFFLNLSLMGCACYN